MPDDAAEAEAANLGALPDSVLQLVRVAAAIAGLDEQSLRQIMETAANEADNTLVEEVILQSYLFAGFPRALNAARIWRSIVPAPARGTTRETGDLHEWRERGEATCKRVYGAAYERLRQNIRALHPLLDEWMVVDGYGKVLSCDVL